MTWNFAMQAIDHIVNSAAKTHYMSGGQMHCGIVFRGPNGAAARVAAQHSQDYSAWYASVPGLKVIAPYAAADAKGLLKAAIRDPGPVIFLENEILYGQSFEVPKLADFVLPIGKARIARSGKDVTIVSYARGMAYALDAAKRLADEGIEAEVIDLRTLAPARHGHGARLGTEDEPHRHGGGGLVGLLDRHRDLRGASPRKLSIISTRHRSRSPAPTCRCLTPPISRSSLCPRLTRSSPRQIGLLPGVMRDMSEAPMTWKQGGCHCGAVRFEVLAPDEIEATECTCSICRKSGYLHLIVPAARFQAAHG